MRPTRLMLENFGPYRARAEIDFASLGEFFLICGKTGSGKSTLFDAMTYALFGQAPGGRRGVEAELVSDFARLGEKPLVEFEFSLSGARYRIRRVAPYRRPKRGGGVSDVLPSAELHAGDAESATGWRLLSDGVRDTNELMKALVGLTAEEFSKVILLPQGDFQRFLEMESTERSQVLEKLFPVARYERIAELARERTQAAKTRLDGLSAELGRVAADLGDGAEEMLRARREEMEKALADETEAMTALSSRELVLERERQRAERARRAVEAREALGLLEGRQAAEEARALRVERAKAAAGVLPLISARAKAGERLRLLSADAEGAGAELASLEAQAVRIEEAKARIHECGLRIASGQQELFSLGKALEAWTRRADAAARLGAARTRLALLEARRDKDAKETAELLARRVACSPAPGEEAVYREWSKRAVLLDGLLKRKGERSEALEEARRLCEAAARKRDEGAAAREEAAEILAGLEHSAAESEAGRLAAALAPGEPCPVCGSRDHPMPARQAETDEGVLVSALGEARISFTRASERAAALEAGAVHAAARAEELETEVAGIARDIEAASGSEGIGKLKAFVESFESRTRDLASVQELLAGRSAATEALRAETEQAGAELLALEKVLAEIERGSGLEDPSEALREAEASLKALEGEKRGLERFCAEWESSVATVKARLGTLVPQRDQAMVLLEAERARLAEGLAAAGMSGEAEAETWAMPAAALAAEARASAEFREGLAAARAKAASLEGDLPPPDSVLPDLAALERSVGEARSALAAARGRSDAARLEIGRLESALARRAALEEERAALEEDSRTLYQLSRLLNGDIQGRRLPFKNYILAMYFREVTRRASIHLSTMSDGRYYLKPDDGQASGRGKTGLGLRVLDSWTGLDRPTATLSGGEKFLTSISLALGLADSLRDRNGGVSLDSVFIDEGFGSLDDEALDRAITVLDRIRGSRVIGIVSHVAGLKARIPARIEVEKSASGSTLSQSTMVSDQAR